MRQADTYGEPTVYKSPGCTVIVYRPILTEDERARRMKEIEKAAAALLISTLKTESEAETKTYGGKENVEQKNPR